MAREADCGFVLWDGNSPGSLANIHEFLALRKPALAWLAPEQRFFTLRQSEDLAALPQR
jgi:hypothetical protein